MKTEPSKTQEMTEYSLFNDMLTALEHYRRNGANQEHYNRDEQRLLSALMDTYCLYNEFEPRRPYIMKGEQNLWKAKL